MARAHFVRPVLDENGNVLSDIVVRVFNTEDGELVPAVYLEPLAADPVAQPITFADGVIDFYLLEPQRVRLGVKQGAAAEVFFEDIDVLSVEDKTGTVTTIAAGTPVVTDRADGDRHIDNADSEDLKEFVLYGGEWLPLGGGASSPPTFSAGAPTETTGRTEGDLHYDITDPLKPVPYVLFGDPLAWAPAGSGLTEEEADALFLTQAEGDLRYAPLVPEDEEGVADPETGEADTLGTTFSLQTVVAGDLAVSPNIVKPGLRVVKAAVAHTIVARVDTVPTGASIIIAVRRINGGVLAGTVGTVTIPAGTSVGVTTNLAHACAKGDILKFEVTQVGSTVAGADINLSVDFK